MHGNSNQSKTFLQILYTSVNQKKDVWEPMAVEEGGWMANHLWCRSFQLHVFSVWKSLTLGSHLWHFYNNSIHVRPNVANCYRLWGRRCEMFHRARCISTAKHRPRLGATATLISLHVFQLKMLHKMGQMKTNKTKNKHTRPLLFKIKESNIYDKSCLSEIHLKQELFLLRKSQKSPKKINICSLSISFFHFSL